MPRGGLPPPGNGPCHWVEAPSDTMSRSDAPNDSDGIDSDSAAFAERLLAQFLTEPSQVPPPWRRYFIELLEAGERPTDGRSRPNIARSDVPPSDRIRSERARPATARRGPAADGAARQLHLDGALLQDRVDHLIRAYRVRGHLAAKLDPLGLPRPPCPDLLLEAHGLAAADLERPVSAAWVGVPGRKPSATLWLACGARTAATSACSSCTSTTPRLAIGCSSGWNRPRTASACRAGNSCGSSRGSPTR